MPKKTTTSRNGGARFTPTQREEVLSKVAKLDRMGFNQHDISRQVGVSQPQVCLYLAELRERHVKSADADVKVMVAARLEQYRGILQEAWEEWERSKLDGMETASEFARPWRPIDPRTKKPMGKASKKLVKVKETTTRTGRVGDPRFLSIMLDCLHKMSQLECLYPEKVTRVKGMSAGGGADQSLWDRIAGILAEPDVDTVEEEIKGMALAHRGAAEGDERPDGDGHE